MLTRRILSGVVAVPALIVLVWAGGGWYLGAVLVGAAVATFELFGMLHAAGHRPLAPVGVAVSVGFILDAAFPSPSVGVLQAVLAVAIVVSASWLMRRTDWSGAVLDWSLTFLPALYVGGLMRYFVPLRELPAGMFWTLTVLVGTWLCDTLAYSVGRSLGRTKLAPRISPGKSVEGAVAGVLAAVVVGVGAGLVGEVSLARLAGLGLVVGVCAVFGDLIESFVKRQSGAKDSGMLIPGHGGILDRIDSWLLAVTGAYFYVVATA